MFRPLYQSYACWDNKKPDAKIIRFIVFCQFQTFFAYYCIGSSKAKMDIGLQLHTPIFFGLSVCEQLCIPWRNSIEFLNEKRLQYIDSFIGQLCSRQVSLSIGQHFYATTKKIQKSVLPFIFSSYDILKLVWLETLSCVTGLHLSRRATLISTL